MSTMTPDRIIMGMMAATAILCTVLRPGWAGYLSILLVVVFVATYWRTQTWPDRLIYLACCGTVLVAIAGAVSVWEGLAIAWMVAGVIAAATGVHVSVHDLPAVLAAGAVTFAITQMIEMANHVLLPLAVLCGITGCIIAVMAIRDYRFRKQFTGAPV